MGPTSAITGPKVSDLWSSTEESSNYHSRPEGFYGSGLFGRMETPALPWLSPQMIQVMCSSNGTSIPSRTPDFKFGSRPADVGARQATWALLNKFRIRNSTAGSRIQDSGLRRIYWHGVPHKLHQIRSRVRSATIDPGISGSPDMP